MRWMWITLLLLIAAACLAQDAPVYTLAEGTAVEVVLPDGFAPARGMPGFINKDLGCLITVDAIAKPYKVVTADFAKEKLAALGMELLAETDAKFGGIDGWLITVRQTIREAPFMMWRGAFGDDEQTLMVTAMAPEKLREVVEEVLVEAVRSARLSPRLKDDPFLGLSFHLNVEAPYKVARRVAEMAIITRDGAYPAQPGTPALAAGTVMGTPAGNPTAIAALRLLPAPGLKDFNLEQTATITIDGLSGIAVTATAKVKATGAPVSLYLVILPNQDRYHYLQAFAPADDAGAMEVLKKAAGSFKLDAKPAG